jgi:hypothetical protein
MSSDYILAYGTHASAQDGRCAMEWVSYLAGEPHSDQPICVSPALRATCIALNDGLDQAPRQRLRPYLPRTIGTADDGLDTQRGWMAMDWLARVYTPAWLHLAGLTEHADRLHDAVAVTGPGSLQRALELLEAARREARSARARAFGSPLPTGWAAAVAAGVAGREAAWTCAGAAAWAAARIGIGDIAGDRARAAARAAAGDAAAIAVRRSRTSVGQAGARAAAHAALEPTLQGLADSALKLLDRMLPTEPLSTELLSAELLPGLEPAVAAPVPVLV